MTRAKTSRGGRGRHLNTVGASVVVSAPNMAAGGGGDSSLDGPGAANVDLCGTCNNLQGLMQWAVIGVAGGFIHPLCVWE